MRTTFAHLLFLYAFHLLYSANAQNVLYYFRTAKSLNNLNELADEKSEYSERFVR